MALPRRPFPVPHLPGQGLLTSCDAAVYGGKGIKKCWIFHIEVLVQRRVRQCEPPRQQLQLVYNSKNYDLWIFRNHKYSVVYKQLFFFMDVYGTYRQHITKKFMRFSNTTVRVLDGGWPWPSRAGSVTLAEGVATSDQSHLGLLGQRQKLWHSHSSLQ